MKKKDEGKKDVIRMTIKRINKRDGIIIKGKAMNGIKI